MITDQKLASALRGYYAEQPAQRPDRERMARGVLDAIHGQPQGRRIWWPFRRRTAPAPGIPSREFQPTRIPATNGHAPTGRFQTISSAVRFVVAGVIVALFGGFLLASVLTQQPSDEPLPAAVPSASPSPEAEPTAPPSAAPERNVITDLLPGVALVTEEVEPGVLRVVNDGYRDLSRHPEGDHLDPNGILGGTIASGRDGSVWVFWPDGFFRLGADETHARDGEPGLGIREDIEVAPDGRIWRVADGDLRSFDGASWTTEREGVSWNIGMDMWTDGTVWALDGGGLARLGVDGWTEFAAPLVSDEPRLVDFWVSPVIHDAVRLSAEPFDAQAEILAFWGEGDCPGCGLDMWVVDGENYGVLPAGAVAATIRRVDMDERGDYWVYQMLEVPQAGNDRDAQTVPYLVHVKDGRDRGQVYSDDEGVPLMGVFYEGFKGFLKAAPDGSVWMTPSNDWETTGNECDGLAHLDGTTWTHYLRGICIYAIDIASDGTAWLQAGEFRPMRQAGDVHTYVIRPEIAAATTP